MIRLKFFFEASIKKNQRLKVFNKSSSNLDASRGTQKRAPQIISNCDFPDLLLKEDYGWEEQILDKLDMKQDLSRAI